MVKKNTTESIDEIQVVFHELMKMIGRASAGDMVSIVNEYELTMPQIITLNLASENAQTVSGLAEALKFTPGAVSRLVDNLVRKGLLTREEEDDDRRKKTLGLTRLGKTVRDRLEVARRGSFTATLSKLNPALMEEFRGILKRVVEALQKENSFKEQHRS